MADKTYGVSPMGLDAYTNADEFIAQRLLQARLTGPLGGDAILGTMAVVLAITPVSDLSKAIHRVFKTPYLQIQEERPISNDILSHAVELFVS